MTDLTTGTPSAPAAPGAASAPPPAGSAELRHALARVRAEVGKAVVGQEGAVTGLIIALLARGHVLLEGVPGVAKTLLVRSLSEALQLSTTRIQFTPDLMPGDILGSNLFNFQTSTFTLTRGPVFCELLLADEINRTPPKTQAALLEAMQERRVTLDGTAHALPDAFMVVATQNPIESQGVYPLPEAQLDRFLFKLTVGYPAIDEERRIVARFGASAGPPSAAAQEVSAVAGAGVLAQAVAAVAGITLAEPVADYVVRLVRATRDSADLSCGASPRAAVLLANAARARAAIQGRDYVLPDDVKALAPAVLRHRLLLSPAAEIEGKAVDALVAGLVERTEAPR
jgi:MoxR-like ATPase